MAEQAKPNMMKDAVVAATKEALKEAKVEEKKVEMEYRMLGNTGLKVSVLGLGTMSFTSEEQAMSLISTVRKHGVNFFDTAEMYGMCR